MHPAPSAILLSVLSGPGFGLLVFLGMGVPAVTGLSAFVFFTVAYLFAVGGLVASTFHLGNPRNAPKAFTQWRTSWLSREAWLSALALVVMAGYGAGLVFAGARIAALGYLGAVLSLLTVVATSMIYGQLKTVPRWNHWSTPVLFVGYAATGGALLAGQMMAGLWGLGATGLAQVLVWRHGDGRFAAAGQTTETATGLGRIGAVRQLEAPHTGRNYLLTEMVYVIGRKHAVKLRGIAIALGVVLPAALLLLFPASHGLAVPVVAAHLAGALVSRWLFFAEAEHVVGLYYGARQG